MEGTGDYWEGEEMEWHKICFVKRQINNHYDCIKSITEQSKNWCGETSRGYKSNIYGMTWPGKGNNKCRRKLNQDILVGWLRELRDKLDVGNEEKGDSQTDT